MIAISYKALVDIADLLSLKFLHVYHLWLIYTVKNSLYFDFISKSILD